MTVFLTSSPTGPLDGSRRVDGLDHKNGFVEALAARWTPNARCLILAADPEEFGRNDEMAAYFQGALAHCGLTSRAFHVWDARVEEPSREALHGYDVLILGGGHVPTQNAFFQALGLREKLAGYEGLVMGISAGSMNAAELVYAQPELPGEASDPDYVRWLPGLGLTGLNLLPHYQMVKDSFLDGRRLFEDVTRADSYGHSFLAIPDGSYVLLEGGRAALYGEGWRVQEGGIWKICEENGTVEV